MKVTFLTPVQHGANFHAEGSDADLKAADAELLIEQGLAMPAAKAKASRSEAEQGEKVATQLLSGGLPTDEA